MGMNYLNFITISSLQLGTNERKQRCKAADLD